VHLATCALTQRQHRRYQALFYNDGVSSDVYDVRDVTAPAAYAPDVIPQFNAVTPAANGACCKSCETPICMATCAGN
jgi:hypothetical protein